MKYPKTVDEHEMKIRKVSPKIGHRSEKGACVLTGDGTVYDTSGVAADLCRDMGPRVMA